MPTKLKRLMKGKTKKKIKIPQMFVFHPFAEGNKYYKEFFLQPHRQESWQPRSNHYAECDRFR